MIAVDGLREAAQTLGDLVTQPLTPTIPGRWPWMPVPKRNVCWLLAEMRSFYETQPQRWTQGQFNKPTFHGRAYCLVGLAYHLSRGDRRLARSAIDAIGESLDMPKPLRETRVMFWNDAQPHVAHVIAVIAHAERRAERAGHCEP